MAYVSMTYVGVRCSYGCTGMVCTVMAYTFMANIVRACVAMAYIGLYRPTEDQTAGHSLHNYIGLAYRMQRIRP